MIFITKPSWEPEDWFQGLLIVGAISLIIGLKITAGAIASLDQLFYHPCLIGLYALAAIWFAWRFL